MAKSEKTPRIIGLMAGFAAAAALISTGALWAPRLEYILDVIPNIAGSFITAIYATSIAALSATLILRVIKGAERAQPQPSGNIETNHHPLPDNQRARQLTPENANEFIIETINSRITYLQSDVSRLQYSSITNLIFGMIFSLGALGYLVLTLPSTSTPSANWVDLIEKFAPRITVGFLIQLIGYFFLRLYISQQGDIRYINNEILNFESKAISYYISLGSADKQSIKLISQKFSDTERNFIIKKNERVINEIDREYNDVKDMLQHFTKLKTKSPKAHLPEKEG